MTLVAGLPASPGSAAPRTLAWGAAAAIAATALLPADTATVAALLAIIVFGVPHGALDGEIGRDRLRPSVGRWWLPVFAIPYLALAACVLVAWRLAPGATLAIFLAASVRHFGEETAVPGDRLGVLFAGGVAIAVPSLVHPAATAAILGTVSGLPGPALARGLFAAAAVWLVVVAAGVLAAPRDARPALGEPLALAALFVALPPLTAFAIYFVVIHAPAHVARLVRSRTRALRVVDWQSAARLAAPWTALTLVLGAALWPLYGGPVPARLLALTLQGLAALTLPHMLLEAGVARYDRDAWRTSSCTRGMTMRP